MALRRATKAQQTRTVSRTQWRYLIDPIVAGLAQCGQQLTVDLDRSERCGPLPRRLKAVETQGKGSVLAVKAVETQGKGSVLPGRPRARRRPPTRSPRRLQPKHVGEKRTRARARARQRQSCQKKPAEQEQQVPRGSDSRRITPDVCCSDDDERLRAAGRVPHHHLRSCSSALVQTNAILVSRATSAPRTMVKGVVPTRRWRANPSQTAGARCRRFAPSDTAFPCASAVVLPKTGAFACGAARTTSVSSWSASSRYPQLATGPARLRQPHTVQSCSQQGVGQNNTCRWRKRRAEQSENPHEVSVRQHHKAKAVS